MACMCDGTDCSVPEPLRAVCKAMSGTMIPLVMKSDKSESDLELIDEFRVILFELAIMGSIIIDKSVEETIAKFFTVVAASKRRLDEANAERQTRIAEARKAVEAQERVEPAPPTVPTPVFDAVRAESVLRSWNPTTATKH